MPREWLTDEERADSERAEARLRVEAWGIALALLLAAVGFFSHLY